MPSVLRSAARVLPVVALVALAACRTSPQDDAALPPPSTEPPAPPPASVEQIALAPLGGSGVSGTVAFTEFGGQATEIRYTIDGLSPGGHGLHLHNHADCGADATGEPGSAAGGYFVPDPWPFGERPAPSNGRIDGDLATITADARGHAEGVVVDSTLGFEIFGNAVIVHEAVDAPTTRPDDAGRRVACGVPEPRRESGHH